MVFLVKAFLIKFLEVPLTQMFHSGKGLTGVHQFFGNFFLEDIRPIQIELLFLRPLSEF